MGLDLGQTADAAWCVQTATWIEHSLPECQHIGSESTCFPECSAEGFSFQVLGSRSLPTSRFLRSPSVRKHARKCSRVRGSVAWRLDGCGVAIPVAVGTLGPLCRRAKSANSHRDGASGGSRVTVTGMLGS